MKTIKLKIFTPLLGIQKIVVIHLNEKIPAERAPQTKTPQTKVGTSEFPTKANFPLHRLLSVCFFSPCLFALNTLLFPLCRVSRCSNHILVISPPPYPIGRKLGFLMQASPGFLNANYLGVERGLGFGN